MINIILIDREVYESAYRDGLILVFDTGVKNSSLYFNMQKDHWLEKIRTKRFYGEH